MDIALSLEARFGVLISQELCEIRFFHENVVSLPMQRKMLATSPIYTTTQRTMKKLFSLIAFGLLFTACTQGGKEMRLTGSEFTTDEIYLIDIGTGETDTLTISDGSFDYVYDKPGIPKIMQLTDGHSFFSYVIAEKGKLNVNGTTRELKGTPQNERYMEFLEAYREAVMEFEDEKTALLESKEDVFDFTEEEMSKLNSLVDAQATKARGITKQYYEKEKATQVGALVLSELMSLVEDAEFEALYKEGGEAVREFPLFKMIMEANLAEEKTQAGSKYLDFEGINPQNESETIRLSDFVAKGNYVLIDFWASWCGPCRKAMPEIKSLHEAYGDKGLTTIGVVVKDDLEAHREVAEALQVTWPQIFVADEVGDLYGIKAIPLLILLDKDGTILVRTNEKEEIIEKIQSLLGA